MNLDMYLHGRLIGRTVSRSRGKKFAVEYAEDIRSTMPDESILLSCSLPTPGPSGPSEARAFLEGLLPEGNALGVMAARVRDVRLGSDGASLAEPSDVINLLAAYGRECAGAVVLVPEGDPAPGPGSYRPLDHSDVERLISNLPNNPLGSDAAGGIRMSLAGNQPKLVVTMFGDAWFEPCDGAATTHIIKPTDVWALSSDNEAIVMEVARTVGLTTSETWVEDFGGVRAFVSRRFDRIVDTVARTVTRRHQEDMCQALGLRPRDKYLIGRPSLRMARLLRSVPTAPGTNAQKLLEQTVFRAVIGDGDGHGKNYGLIIEEGQVALSPLYDSLTTMVYPDLTGRMGAPIGRQENLAKVDIEAIVEEGRACGLSEDVARDIGLGIASRVKSAVDDFSGTGIDGRAIEAVTELISARAERLLDGKPMGSAPRASLLSEPRGNASVTIDVATKQLSHGALPAQRYRHVT